MTKRDALTSPISRVPAFIDHEVTFSPRDDYSPTPLDPYNCQLNKAVDYPSQAQTKLQQGALEALHEFSLPEDVYMRGLSELLEAQYIRCSRNTESFQRLIHGIDWQTADPTLVDIIQRARQGAADPQELLRLIKEYPVMISVEFFKSHPMFNVSASEVVRKQLMGKLAWLQRSFDDAEIVWTGLEDDDYASKYELTPNGAIVFKQVLGKALSHDSAADIVLKQSHIATPNNTPLPVQSRRVKIGGEALNVLPLGVSAYFRVADYKERVGRDSQN